MGLSVAVEIREECAEAIVDYWRDTARLPIYQVGESLILTNDDGKKYKIVVSVEDYYAAE